MLARNEECIRQLHGAAEAAIEEGANGDVHAARQLLNSAHKNENGGGELVFGGIVNLVNVLWVSTEDGIVDGKHRT